MSKTKGWATKAKGKWWRRRHKQFSTYLCKGMPIDKVKSAEYEQDMREWLAARKNTDYYELKPKRRRWWRAE